MGKIEVRKTELSSINWRDASWLQPKALKTIRLDAMIRLKKALVSNGYMMPLYYCTIKDKEYILDGHHRQQAMIELTDSGEAIPDVLPAIKVYAKDKAEAKKLLILCSSRYAKINKSGFLDFFKAELEQMQDVVSIPDLTIDQDIVSSANANMFTNKAIKHGPKAGYKDKSEEPKQQEVKRTTYEIYMYDTEHATAKAILKEAKTFYNLSKSYQVVMKILEDLEKYE